MKNFITIIIAFLFFTFSFAQNKFGNPEVNPIQIQKTLEIGLPIKVKK